MSFRRDVLAEFQFDDALAAYYIGDDFEMAYRVSRDYQLFQTHGAQLMHYSSPPEGKGGPGAEARANGCGQPPVSQPKAAGRRMEDAGGVGVVQFGIFLLTLLWWLLAGRGSARLVGTVEGHWDVLGGAAGGPHRRRR